VNEEEREYLNETIRNLNNQLVDALRERDEARQQVRDIIQRKEAQMLTLIEEGNGVARVLYCSKEDGK